MIRREEARSRTVSVASFFLLLLGSIALLASCATMQAPIGTIPEVDRSAPPSAGRSEAPPEAGPVAGERAPEGEGVPVAAVEENAAEGSDDTSSVDEEVSPAPHDELEVSPPLASDEQVEREREILNAQAPEFDIPMVVNDRVTAWVDYYCGPHREKFAASLVRSGRYLDMVRRTFAEAGIPQDLAYMAHVESAFKPRAYSRAKAKGLFQFISSTGRRYGLHADAWVDERSDPEQSARAAAAYLKDLYAMFGDWHLALAAYNAGEGKVARGLTATNAPDFWSLAKTPKLRAETKNYVPAILAATLIAKDPAKYGFDVAPDPPLVYETAVVKGSFDLDVIARKAGIPVEDLKDLNPELRKWRTPPNYSLQLRVPPNTAATVASVLGSIPESSRIESVEHVVRSGDTLGRIAGRYRVSVASIQAANKMGRSTVIHPGRVLIVPTSSDWEPGETEVAARAARAPRGGSYKVRSGDTLSSIARENGTTPAAIAAASGIDVHAILAVGTRLSLPGAPEKVAAAPKRASQNAAATPRRSTAATAAAGPQKHRVRRGETLTDIAARYRTSVAMLCEWNAISNADVLHPGRMLKIYSN